MSIPRLQFAQDSSSGALQRGQIRSTKDGRLVVDQFQIYPRPDTDICYTRASVEPEGCFQPSVDKIGTIEEAITGFKSPEFPISSPDPSTFLPFTKFVDRLRVMSKAVHTMVAFAVVRSLNTEKYSEEENAIAHGSIASHIGIRRSANLRDTTHDAKPRNRVSEEGPAPSKLRESTLVQEDVPHLSHVKFYAPKGSRRDTNHHRRQHRGFRSFIMQIQLWSDDPHRERMPGRSFLSSLGPNFGLIPAIIASSYVISRYRSQETVLKYRSGPNIVNSVAAWKPSPLQFYCSCGIWAVALVLWFHRHHNEEHQTLILALGILSAICIGATLNMSLEQMGRQVMPWCVIVALFLSAIVHLVASTHASSGDLDARMLFLIPTVEHHEDAAARQGSNNAPDDSQEIV